MGQSLWYPYTQMAHPQMHHRVVEAVGCELVFDSGERLIDGISSWWAVIHGYRHPRLDAVAKQQLDHVAHVMLGGLVTAPAEALADALVEVTPDGLQHVFFSDSGSVGVEVALKMAIQYWMNLGHPERRKFIALEKAYHGDTTACMMVCDPAEGMHRLFSALVPQQHFVPSPRGGYQASEACVAEDLDQLEDVLMEFGHEIAAMIVEPLLQGAGGMQVYSPAYLAGARALCAEFDVLFICDEVATGFGRTGTLFASEQAAITPDIMVLGKGLTAGYGGHAATLATEAVYTAFLGDSSERALMHGPTFMGNALMCRIALESLTLFQETPILERIREIESVLKARLGGFTAPGVVETRVLGAMGAIEVDHPDRLRQAQAIAREQGVWLRPFGRTLYTMPPYCISDAQLHRVCDALCQACSDPASA